jgi:acetyltransferase
VLPPTASVGNPVDLVGDADAARYGNALAAAGGAADAALVILTAQAATDALGVARAVLGATRGWAIPVAAAFVGGARVTAGVRALEEGGVPCYPFPEPAVHTLAGMALVAERRRLRRDPSPSEPPPADAARHVAALRQAGVGRPGWLELAPLLAAYGVPVAAAELAATPEAVRAAAARLGGPVALKIVSPDIAHKTDVGGVMLGLATPEAAATAAGELLRRVRAVRPDAAIRGILVQRAAPPGPELLLGVVRDPQFGALVVVGFGGIYVEVLRDTSMRLAPVGVEDARAMLDELRMAPVLRGVRGQAPVDRAALAETVMRFARLASDWPDLTEIEVNPLIATPAGVTAVDARARLEEGADRGGDTPQPA